MKVYAGTSGFSYKEWKGKFYPDKLPANKMLEFYAGRLPAVEINNTFYRMPKLDLLRGWRDQVPDGFRFAIKASQRITHRKRLRDAGEEVAYLFDALDVLEDKLGIVLFQLPPFLRADAELLDAFLSLLPVHIPCAFEFRHVSWFDETVFDVLRKHGKTLCIADAETTADQHLRATTKVGYVRLRRTEYSDRELRGWADKLKALDWEQLYVFFKHEDDCGGPEMATGFLNHI